MNEQKQPRRLNTETARSEGKNVYSSATGSFKKPNSSVRYTASYNRSSIDQTAPMKRQVSEVPPRSAGSSAGNRRRKRSKKKGGLGCLGLFLLLLLVLIALVFFAVKIISKSVAGDVSISEIINTPTEYQGDVVNVLVCGVDAEEGRQYSDKQTNDGMTDMIMYVSFDVANKKVSMLQIPRNTFVGNPVTVRVDGTEKSYSASNGQINSIMYSNGGDINALAEVISDQMKLPIDYYITINMDALREVVDVFGGIEVYVPQEIEYNGSLLHQGYQTLDGNAAEFFVRNRKGAGYERSDLDRLNMQRYFYSGLLARFRTMNIRDVAKIMPAFTLYVETDMPTTTMVSLGVSLLQVDSANIMVAQMPIYASSQYYNNNSVVVAGQQEIADLLNEYFRTYTGPVEASQLSVQSWHPSGSASDPNVQFMGALDEQSRDAQQNNNLDGSNTSYS